ncbi:lytic murein transglycosylase B [uncultured Marinobacter sp.]|uniref:lytic murein transglycosylase B n=1 Tax=uncultured Marinobacter sp. TaxID=187379 RepID=UPI00262EA97D|nr:lytic murein transglycosylase B [uncultured Marinobacter sp.]
MTAVRLPVFFRFAPLLFVMFTSLAFAQGYDATPQGRALIEEMVTKHGYDQERLEALLADATRIDRILESISRPAEKTLTWQEYRKIFIKPERVERGLKFLKEHDGAFARAESEFGVPATVIAAIIGVETWYGKYTGNYRVMDALATLAFDYPPRSRFFRSELVQYLLMTREQGFDPLDIKGSYAGAMGYGQFIASSYRHFAIDFDGDGIADILTNPVDAIGSVANYFSAHHWRGGESIAEPLGGHLPVDSPLLTPGLKPKLTVTDYRTAGLEPVLMPSDDAPARAILLQGREGPELWLTYHNFYVITRYNHSHLYAMAVLQLADELNKHRNPDRW